MRRGQRAEAGPSSLAKTRDASERQRGRQYTPPLQRILKELREEGKRRGATDLDVKYIRNIAVAEESLVLQLWNVTPSGSMLIVHRPLAFSCTR